MNANVKYTLPLALLCFCAPAWGYDVDIPGPSGSVPLTIQLSHAAANGSLITPDPPMGAPFLPPSIFSAPLPRGSGARALGFGGAFTALADDATAASWNPAGLVQLERSEGSIVFRVGSEHNSHNSPDPSFLGGSDGFESANINYFSLVMPFFSKMLGKNVVASINYQEVFDFTQDFHAKVSRSGQEPLAGKSASRSTSQEVTIPFKRGINVAGIPGLSSWDGTVTLSEQTFVRTELNELLDADLVSDLSFEQEGGLSAISPAFAVELTRKVSFGGAINIHTIDPFMGSAIRSRTQASYSGTTIRSLSTSSTRRSSGTYSLTSVVTPPRPTFPTFPLNASGTFSSPTDRQTSGEAQPLYTEGVYTEDNRYTGWSGINGNLGVLWAVSRALTLGASIDLPWVAEASQSKTTRNQATTFNIERTQILNVVDTSETVDKDIEFEFPMACAMGLVWRWTQNLYSTLDLGFTQWSEFSYKAAGETRVNPMSGRPHSQEPLDDTWSTRTGLEYLLNTEARVIPVRGGLAWEERPSIDGTDDYFTFSLGSGIPVGKAEHEVFIDLVYAFTYANDVRGFVPLQTDLNTDVTEHQAYLSLLKHF